MSQKTFFFRETYNAEEMYERIYAIDFISYFKDYLQGLLDENGEELEPSKGNCYLALAQAYNYNEDTINSKIGLCFSERGRLGDKLNVKLFEIQDKYDELEPDILAKIDELVNEKRNIKEINSLSYGLDNNTFLEVVSLKEKFLDFKFKFEIEKIVHTPLPTKEVEEVFVEARYYFKMGIVAIFNPNNILKFNKNVLTIIHLMFKGYSARYKEITFDEAQLIMIQLKLNGELSSPKLRSEDDLRVGIYGINDLNYQQPIVKFTESQDYLKIYELSSICSIEGHKFNLRITEEGKIHIDQFVTPDVLDSIINDIYWVILSNSFYKDFNSQVGNVVDKKNVGILQSQCDRRVKDIKDNFVSLIEKHKKKNMREKEMHLVSTLILNIGHFLCNEEKNSLSFNKVTQIEDYEEKYSLSDYTFITTYLTDYRTIIEGKNRSESQRIAQKTVMILQYIVSLTEGDAVRIISEYMNFIGEEVIC